jgi:hypothetical protein
LPFCTKCGRDFPDDVSFCPYCKVPLIRRSRSFIGRTLGGPGGFKLSEVPEYLTRKTEAIGIMVFGLFVMIFGSIFVALVSSGVLWGPAKASQPPNFLAVIITFITGFVILAYGAHLWNKITHIMWTRQALREYGVPSIFVKEAKRQLPLTSEEMPSDERFLLDDENSIERYLDMLEQRLLEGKISEATYMALKQKFEEKIRKEKIKKEREKIEKELHEPLFIPIKAGNSNCGFVVNYFNEGKLEVNKDKIIFMENTGRKVEIEFPNILKIQQMGISVPYGIQINVTGNFYYQFYIDANIEDTIVILKSLEEKIEEFGFKDKIGPPIGKFLYR